MTASAPFPSTPSPHAPRLTRAVVITLDGETIHVRAGAERLSCRRAASCLLAPEPGDRVLVAVEPGEPGWLLAVLERAGEGRLRIVLDGDAELSSEGVLRLRGDEGVELTSRRHTRVTSKTVELSARLAEVAIDRATVVGTQLHSHFTKIRTLAEQLDVVADRVVERLKRRYQLIEQTDQLRAGHVDMRANKTMAVHGEHTVVTARELVKVDAEQIHVG